MKLNDLFERHYRTLPAYQTAKAAFEPVTNPELTPGKRRQAGDTALEKFNNYMYENGFEKLGQGAFGAVYEKPGYPWVFKLFANDAAYLAWINYVVNHQSNEHVPKIKGKPFRITDGVFAVRMEKLSRMPDTWWDDPLLDKVVYGGITSQNKEELKELGHEDLIDVLSAIHHLAHGNPNNDWNTDMHGGNILMRGDIPVITDPLVDRTAFG